MANPSALVVIAEKAKGKGKGGTLMPAPPKSEPDMPSDEDGADDDVAYQLGKEFADAMASKNYPAVYEAVAAIARRAGSQPAGE